MFKKASRSSKSKKMKPSLRTGAQKKKLTKPKGASVTPAYIADFARYLTGFGNRALEGHVYAADCSDATDGIALSIARKCESGQQMVGAWEYIRLRTIHRERERFARLLDELGHGDEAEQIRRPENPTDNPLAWIDEQYR